MAAAGVSTLGITFGYGTETTAGTKPTSFKQLTRINAIGGINIEPEQIDASALEDAITRYVKGRADTGGSFAVTVNFTSETVADGLHLSQPIRLLLVEIECGLKLSFPEKRNLSLLLHSRPSRFHSQRSDRMNF